MVILLNNNFYYSLNPLTSGALVLNGPFSSHVFRFHPRATAFKYSKYDDEFHSTCCLRTQNCNLYRERHPVRSCEGYMRPVRCKCKFLNRFYASSETGIDAKQCA